MAKKRKPARSKGKRGFGTNAAHDRRAEVPLGTQSLSWPCVAATRRLCVAASSLLSAIQPSLSVGARTEVHEPPTPSNRVLNRFPNVFVRTIVHILSLQKSGIVQRLI